ncbi:head-tail connector protein [Anoxybacteroides amylolyticum]|uniref:Phage gp6-like head-tail connector family protein n=1 Tax=Anoxybacteroides amylolyticum TaxID=294699 RepID=A0A160F6P0_9BACL|nr:hypothetical protein [Anoxybacillus amylolyticus]ANB62287.1 phage gp6-like head-tail connector family protein [Anoxybacillus amylolyticus]
MTVLEIVKAELENPPSDERLMMYIDKVAQAIKTFCNRDDIPEELLYVHADMVVDYIRLKQKNEPDAEPAVQSIKEGDVQVTFTAHEKSQGETEVESVAHSYKNALYKFRKMRW